MLKSIVAVVEEPILMILKFLLDLKFPKPIVINLKINVFLESFLKVGGFPPTATCSALDRSAPDVV